MNDDTPRDGLKSFAARYGMVAVQRQGSRGFGPNVWACRGCRKPQPMASYKGSRFCATCDPDGALNRADKAGA